MSKIISKASMTRRVIVLIVTAFWWLLVWLFGGPGAGADWTRELLHRWFGLSGRSLDVANILVRKSGHVFYYGGLAALIASTLCAFGIARFRSVRFAFLLTLATASFDEWRQTHYSTRTGTAFDLVYDAGGAAAALLLFWAVARRADSGR